MKHQPLFPYKDKSKKIRCLPLQFLFGTLRVKLLLSSVSSQCPDWRDTTFCQILILFLLKNIKCDASLEPSL